MRDSLGFEMEAY